MLTYLSELTSSLETGKPRSEALVWHCSIFTSTSSCERESTGGSVGVLRPTSSPSGPSHPRSGTRLLGGGRAGGRATVSGATPCPGGPGQQDLGPSSHADTASLSAPASGTTTDTRSFPGRSSQPGTLPTPGCPSGHRLAYHVAYHGRRGSAPGHPTAASATAVCPVPEPEQALGNQACDKRGRQVAVGWGRGTPGPTPSLPSGSSGTPRTVCSGPDMALKPPLREYSCSAGFLATSDLGVLSAPDFSASSLRGAGRAGEGAGQPSPLTGLSREVWPRGQRAHHKNKDSPPLATQVELAKGRAPHQTQTSGGQPPRRPTGCYVERQPESAEERKKV